MRQKIVSHEETQKDNIINQSLERWRKWKSSRCYALLKLVGQILAFSRQNELEKIPVDISVIVKEVVKLLRASLPASIEEGDVTDELATKELDFAGDTVTPLFQRKAFGHTVIDWDPS